MKEITKFSHKMFGEIRTMANENGDVYFVGKDVAKALGYGQPDKAIVRHVDDDDRTFHTVIDSLGRRQKAFIINESGLYSLVLSSKLEQAKAFKRWVTSEVLPQIRKTGGYIPTHDAEGHPLSNEEILQLAEQIVGRTLRMLNAPNDNCLTATEVAKSWGMDVQSFNQLLSKMGIQYRRGGQWHLAKELDGLGLTQTRHFLYYSLHGQQKARTYLVWTPEGVRYLNERFLHSDWKSPKLIQLNFLTINESIFEH